jgi:uncharacterized membrane protein YbhN (UPF0104 family)
VIFADNSGSRGTFHNATDKVSWMQHFGIPLIVSTAALIVLFRLTSWRELVTIWQEMQWGWVLIGSLAYCGELVLIGVRAASLLAVEDLSVKKLILISNVHNFINKITPARLGEISFPFLARHYVGINYTKAFAVLVLMRLMDIYTVMFLFSVIFAAYGLAHTDWQWTWLPIACVWFALLVFSLFLLNGQVIKRKKLQLWAPIANIYAFISDLQREIRAVLKTGVRKGAMPCIAMCSCLIWTLLYVTFAALGKAIGLNLALSQLLISGSFAILGTMVPIGGLGHLGALEAGWTLGLLSMGTSHSEAAASALIIGVMTTIFASVMGVVSLAALEIQIRRHTK